VQQGREKSLKKIKGKRWISTIFYINGNQTTLTLSRIKGRTQKAHAGKIEGKRQNWSKSVFMHN